MGQFPRSPFAVPTSSFNAPVQPPRSDPDTGPQATIRVSCEWLPYIRGALTQLLLQTTWLGSDADVDLAQDRANALIQLFLANKPGDCGSPLPEPDGCDCEDDMSGCSVSCDCNGVVTIKCPDGKTYQLVTTLMQAGQPGAGSAQPAPGGGAAHWCFVLSGGSTSFLPTQVNSGDVITIDTLEGAWSDTPVAHWWCPNGWTFFLGQCTGPYPAVAGDPLMSANHMELIAHIGGAYYRILNPDSHGNPQPFTVPPGITNQSVTLLANTSAPSAINGSISFCAHMTNNVPGHWQHTFDYALSPYTATAHPEATGPGAVWVGGQGWTAADFQQPLGDYHHGAFIDIPDVAGSYTITDVRIAYDTELPFDYPSGADVAIFIGVHSGASAQVLSGALVAGTGILDLPGLAETHADMFLFVQTGFKVGSAPTAGTSTLLQLVVEGTGTDPWL